jgi:hypothetical protein
MPQSTSVSGRVTHTVAELTGRSDDEIRLLAGLAVAGIAVAGAIKTVEVLMNLGATFARHAGRSAS